MGITEEALQRMEKRASDFSDGTQTDNPTAHQLVLHVLTLASEVRRLRGECGGLRAAVQAATDLLLRQGLT